MSVSALKIPLFAGSFSKIFLGLKVVERGCERQGTSKTSRKLFAYCMYAWCI
jgi:hypothetical protein